MVPQGGTAGPPCPRGFSLAGVSGAHYVEPVGVALAGVERRRYGRDRVMQTELLVPRGGRRVNVASVLIAAVAMLAATVAVNVAQKDNGRSRPYGHFPIHCAGIISMRPITVASTPSVTAGCGSILNSGE